MVPEDRIGPLDAQEHQQAHHAVGGVEAGGGEGCRSSVDGTAPPGVHAQCRGLQQATGR